MQVLLNSISGEKERYDSLVPLVEEYGCKVVPLCVDDESGISPDADTRFRIALQEKGSKVYLLLTN